MSLCLVSTIKLAVTRVSCLHWCSYSAQVMSEVTPYLPLHRFIHHSLFYLPMYLSWSVPLSCQSPREPYFHLYSFLTQMWITECVNLTPTTDYSFWFIIHLFIKMWAKRNSFSHLVLPILFRQCARCRIKQPQTQSGHPLERYCRRIQTYLHIYSAAHLDGCLIISTPLHLFIYLIMSISMEYQLMATILPSEIMFP